MDLRESLRRMLQQLLSDMLAIQQQGAGYYSCIPIAKRYNKLLEQARGLFGPGDGLMSTFEEAPLEDPKDPADKMKVIQGIRIETSQLIALLESRSESEAK